MKVLLTGASGFVGSHILDRLRAQNVPVALLLRPNSDRTFIQPHLPQVEIRNGSITDPASLRPALDGITHLIHCAGCTKSVGPRGFFDINHLGTRNLVEVANALPAPLQRFVHISSLAAAGVGTAERPRTESDPAEPVSVYGQSKLAGEKAVRDHCRSEFVIIRPPAVYGPRDHGFFTMFKAVNNHVLPRSNPRQALSLVYVRDLAETIVGCLEHPVAARKTYFAANPEAVTGRNMAERIKAHAGVWAIPLPLPAPLLWAVCLFQEALSRLTRKPHVLSRQKYAELRAPGWVCDGSLVARETGLTCTTGLDQGIALTLDWYRQQRWL